MFRVSIGVTTGILLATTSISLADINLGTFGDVHHDIAGGAVSYKDKAGQIEVGTFVSETNFMPAAACHWPNPPYNLGGDIYTVSTISGLRAGDIVKVDNDYLWRASASDPFESYWNQAPYWVLIGDYTHNAGTNSINNWLIYVNNNGADYTMVAGSGQYNLVDTEDDLLSAVGSQFQLVRDIVVYRDAMLTNPLTSGRGYTYSTVGITGGEIIESGSFRTDELTVIPAPGAVVLGWIGLGLSAWYRRRMA